jgi:hypothetical protein
MTRYKEFFAAAVGLCMLLLGPAVFAQSGTRMMIRDSPTSVRTARQLRTRHQRVRRHHPLRSHRARSITGLTTVPTRRARTVGAGGQVIVTPPVNRPRATFPLMPPPNAPPGQHFPTHRR